MQAKKMIMLSTFIGVSFLSGCASMSGYNEKNNPQQQTSSDPGTEEMVNKTIADGTKRIQSTLQKIEKIERGVKPSQVKADTSIVKSDNQKYEDDSSVVLNNYISLNWVKGNVDDLLKKIANQYGFKFEVSGKSFHGVPLVTVSTERSTLREVFTEIGRQIDKSADVVFIPNSAQPTLVLKYKAQQ